MNCELCQKPIAPMSIYVGVEKFIPNLVTFTPEDAKDRGIHIGCLARADG